VAAHREYWRPEEVRVLLLAESHVLTHDHELEAQVRLDAYGHSDAPTEFVRLVYCLGYGERDLVDGAVKPNTGTWQFWQLFAACVDDPPGGKILKTVEQRLKQRIANKVALLEDLRARGVWLLDASPVALYRPGGGKSGPPGNALSAAWEEYSRRIVLEVAPRAVVVIGKGVFGALGEKVKSAVPSAVLDVIPQPQARVSAAEHRAAYRKLYDSVRRFGRPP
jgi:hypothetical protein